MQGHWAEQNQPYEVRPDNDEAFWDARYQELMDSGLSSDDAIATMEDEGYGRPATGDGDENYSHASSLPSAAPEFYEEEPVTLSRVEEVLAIEHGLREACRTLPITIASWIFFTLLIFYHGEIQGSFDSAQTIREAMEAINVPAVNNSVTLRELRIGTITERYDIIQWIHQGLVPTVTVGWRTAPGLKHGQLRRTQQLLGKVKISQTRGVAAECADLEPGLIAFYGDNCHPAGGSPQVFGGVPETRLEWGMAFEPYSIGTNKRKFVAWLDIGRNMTLIDEQIQSLLEYEWLDDDTQDVTIEAMFLNAELNVYSKMEIIFQLHRGGWIQQEIIVTPLRGDVHYHWAVIWLDSMWVAIMLFLVWQAAWHAVEEFKRGMCKWWLKDFFVLIDFMSFIVGTSIAISFWHQSNKVDTFVKLCSGLGAMPAQNGIEAIMTWKTRYILWNFQYETKVQGIFDEFTSLNWLANVHRFFALCYNLIIVCRFYRGFTGQPRIAVILQTINQVAMFLFHYMIVFIIVMVNFALTGYILFGEQLKDWSTIGNAACSAALTLFGRFEYEDLHAVAPVSAAIWFASFFILVCLVLTGMTTATILHHYLAVRLRTGQAGESLVKQCGGLIEDLCYGRSYDGAQKSMPPDKLFEMISLDADQTRIRHLGRFDIDRRMRTRHHVKEAELDPPVDVKFLESRGMDRITAWRFLNKIAEKGHHIAMRHAAMPRLTLFIARQISQLRFGAEHMRTKTTQKVMWSSKAVDRVDLKHAKSVAVATRIRRAQKLPPGWTAHVDEQGKRYLRQTETGLTSWTLPRHLI